MKFLISMNSKMFSKYTPQGLMETITGIDVNRNIDGAEIYINLKSNIEKEYCLELVKLMKDKNWILQIHSVNLYKLDNETLIDYLDYYNKLAIVYGSKLKLTVHPAEEDSIKEAMEESIKTLKLVKEYITKNNLNLEILLENLNRINEKTRCNINEVVYIVNNTDVDGITLDLGHYVYDYSNDLSNISNIDKINNIHIHDINNKADHYPFYYNNVKIEEISKYLKENNYSESIVLEYGLEYLNGITFEEKIKEYITQIQYVRNSINR